MPCSRCGQSRPAKPNPPSRAGRPGTAWHPAQNNSQSKSSGQSVKDQITGLKYVPTN